MKRNLFIFAAFLASFVLLNQKASAQDVRTAVVPVTITLTDAFSITLGATPAVLFEYKLASDYAAAKTVRKDNHFTVTSTKAYNVAVTASTFSPALGLDIVKVGIDPATVAPAGTTYASGATSVPLSGGTLITAGAATTATTFNVIYSIPDASTLIGKATNSPYTTNVTYTITQP